MSEPDERLIKTYLWHGDDCYFVSTINRDSSSIMGGRFAETIVWSFDWEANERGRLLWSDGAGQDSIRSHMKMVERIHKTGSGEEPDDD